MSATEHLLPGKDASLEATITHLQGRLAALGLVAEERSWLNPVDNVWSVHLCLADCPIIYTNGKGGSELAARASALGELFERLGNRYFWIHYYLGQDTAQAAVVHDARERWFPATGSKWPAELLTPELQAFYNPEGSIAPDTLVEHNSGNLARGICALPFTRHSDQATVWFPLNIVGNLYLSNGMAAGNTATEAQTQALSEVAERFVKFRVIADCLCLPDVPEAVIARYPAIAAGIAGLRAAGFDITVKDASLGGKYPVISVNLLNPRDQGVFASFGAHPRFEVALERALTELLQGRALAALDGFPEPGFDAEEVASEQNLEIHFVDSSGVIGWRYFGSVADFEFVDWNFAGSTEQERESLCQQIEADGYEIYHIDFEQLGVYACRMIVPGMSEIYPVEDLEWENNSLGIALREAILNAPDLDEEGAAELREQLIELDIDDQRPVAALVGLAADPGSLWEDLRVGELKTLLALAADDEDGAFEGCQWLKSFGQIAPERLKVYRCIEALLQFDEPEDFYPALTALYGAATLATALAHLARSQRFFNTPAPGLALKGCTLHQRLLQIRAKLPH